jgi:UDP-N-acetylmuramyl tripeptide synthase
MALNAAMALAAAIAWGVDAERAVAAIAEADPVPGRLERVPCPHGFEVLVDFAHNAAGVRAALSTARALAEAAGGRLLVVLSILSVFARPQRRAVGRAAGAIADVLVLTNDRWRADEPADRLPSGLETGARAAGYAEIEVVPDRRSAIARGLALAEPGDIVVIAGRGSMTSQVGRDGRREPFDDRLVARELVARVPQPARA